MVSLYQKDVRDQKGLKAGKGGAHEATTDSENFTIGYHVMKVRVCVCVCACVRVCVRRGADNIQKNATNEPVRLFLVRILENTISKLSVNYQ